MDKYKYFKDCLAKGLYKDAYFVKSCLSLFTTTAKEDYIVRSDDLGYYYIENNNRVYFENGKDTTKPLLDYLEPITVEDGEIPNHQGQLVTTVGRLLQNYILTIGPFGKRVPYINKRFFPKDIYPQILYRWKTSRKAKGIVDDENEIFTEDWLAFAESALSLANYTQTVVPSVTEKALTTNPELVKRAKELFEEYKDTLGEPSTIAKIDAELQAIDKNYLKGDQSEGFLIGGKDYATVRKRLFYHFGIVTGLDDIPRYVNKPLTKGLDVKHLPEYVNDAYSGSIGRGLETADGGVKVKQSTRSAANLKVGIDDCGSKLGKLTKLPDDEKAILRYIGYHFIENGETKEITTENVKSLLGKVINMRYTGFCIAKNNSFCKKCSGPNVSQYPNGITSVNAIPGSRIMNIAMKSMHGTMSRNVTLHVHDFLT